MVDWQTQKLDSKISLTPKILNIKKNQIDCAKWFKNLSKIDTIKMF